MTQSKPKTEREVRNEATAALMKMIEPRHAKQIAESNFRTYPASEEKKELKVEEKKEK